MVPIPPVLLWTLGAVGAAALTRVLVKEWRRVNANLHAHKTTPVADDLVREKIPTLRPDPRTGVYRAD